MIATLVVAVAVLLTLVLPVYPEGVSLDIAAFIGLTVVGGALGLLQRQARRELIVLAPWLIAIVTALLVGSLRNGESRQALEDTLPYVLAALGLFAGRGCSNPRLVLTLVMWVCFVDAFVSLYLLPSFEAGVRSTYNYFRITAGLPLVGVFLSPMLRVTDPRARSPSLLSRPVHLAIVVIMVISVFATISRGMILGLVCGMLVSTYIRRPSRVVLLGLVASLMFVTYTATLEDIGSTYLRLEAASTVQGRMREIDTAWGTFVEYPLFGAGLGAMFEVDGFYKAFVHNMGAYHLWKFGLIGSALLMLPMYVIGRQLRFASRDLRGLALGGATASILYLLTCAAYKTYYLVWIYGVVVGAGLTYFEMLRRRPADGDERDAE